MAVGVRHQLIGLLAGGIEAHRMVHGLLLMERQISVAAINRTTRGVDEVFGAMVAAAFQEMAKAHQIALDVSRRVLQGVTNTGLSRQVHHHSRVFCREESHEGIAVFQGQVLELPGAFGGHGFDLTQPRLLEAGVVVVVQVVEADHPITALQETLRQGCTNETGSTGDQNRPRHQPSPSPTRHRVRPAALTCSGSATARASKTHAGLRIRPARASQLRSL